LQFDERIMEVKDLVEIFQFQNEGYLPIVDFENWRVAVLKFCEELCVSNLETMQKHDQTDEVFVLISGACMLFTGGDGEYPSEVEAVRMHPCEIYNVKKGVWHTHTLDKDAAVLIVENQNTGDSNSPTAPLTNEQKQKIRELYSSTYCDI